MTNGCVCEQIRQTAEGRQFVADNLVEDGYGQNCGGYLEKAKEGVSITQLEHFLSYYENKGDKITYAYLRCPQLILFIAEIMGTPQETIEQASNCVKTYDEGFCGRKNGNYMWGTEEFRNFKTILKYRDICRSIKEEENISSIQGRVQEIYMPSN